jgi:hypothetical protein
MIDTDVLACQPLLKARVVLAEVVKQGGYEGQPFKPERRGERGSQVGSFVLMAVEELPVALVRELAGMSKIGHLRSRQYFEIPRFQGSLTGGSVSAMQFVPLLPCH